MSATRNGICMRLAVLVALSLVPAAAQTQTPTPHIDTICAPSTTVGSGDVGITIFGSNLLGVVIWKDRATGGSSRLPSTFVSATELSAVVPAALVSAVTDADIQVAGQSVESGTVGVQPTGAIGMATITHAALTSGAADGAAASSGQSVRVPAPQPASIASGNALGTARPTAPGKSGGRPQPRAIVCTGSCSNLVLFRVLPAPVITGWNPLQTTEGAPLFLAISGQTFVPPAQFCAAQSQLLWNGEPLRTATVDRSDTISANVPLSLVTRGVVSLSVLNPGDGLSKGVALTINPRPSIITALPDGTVGATYQTQLVKSGGTSPVGWSLVPGSGALPPGLSLDSAGLVSGQPTLAGTYRFTIGLTDAAAASATRDYAVRIFQPDVKPDIVSACPKAVTAGAAGARVTIAVAGSFQPEVDWDGKPLQLEANSVSGGAMFLIVRLTPDLLASAGSHAITIANLDTRTRAASDPIPFRVLQTPAISSLAPQVTTEGARVRLSVNGSNLVASDPGCAAASSLQWNGQPLAGAAVSGGQITSDVPVALVVGAQATVNIVNPDGATSNSMTVTINPAPIITTSLLANAVVNRAYPNTAVRSFGGTAPLAWSMSSGSGLTIDAATGVISGAPATAGDFDVLVELRDAASVTASRTYRVTILPVLDVSITGLPATINPGGSQPAFQLQVNVPGGFPADLRGRLTFSFQPDADLQNPSVKDPALGISAGPDITIPAFSSGLGVLLSPGTSAGTITVTISNVIAAGVAVTPGAPISASTRIASGPPVISACIEEKSSSTLRVRTVGFSPTRELKQALFRFSGAAGSNLKTTEVPVSDAGTRLFNPFYSGQTGLTSFNFRYVQTFTIDGDPNALSTVSVILENAKGQSAPALAAGVCAGQ